MPADITNYKEEGVDLNQKYVGIDDGDLIGSYYVGPPFGGDTPAGNYDDMVAAGNYDETTDTGYMGLATSTELVDGVTLATDIGLTAGTAFNNDAGWLKFYVGPNADCNKDGVEKIVFIAKQPLRYMISWDAIYLAGAVYGTGDNGPATASTGTSATQNAEVTYGGVTYKVRLMTASATDPAVEKYGDHQCTDDAGGGSEWNDLLYRVHEAVPNCTDPTIGNGGTRFHGGPQDGVNWANFTNAELLAGGSGKNNWCQERGKNTSRRVLRGDNGLAEFRTELTTQTSGCGWRPVLEVVQ